MDFHVEALWKVFILSNLKRNPSDPMVMRQRDFVEVITKDLDPPLTGLLRADLEIMYTAEASNHPAADKKFYFSCFVNCVVKIAGKKKMPIEQLMDAHLAPLASKRKVSPSRRTFLPSSRTYLSLVQ